MQKLLGDDAGILMKILRILSAETLKEDVKHKRMEVFMVYSVLKAKHNGKLSINSEMLRS